MWNRIFSLNILLILVTIYIGTSFTKRHVIKSDRISSTVPYKNISRHSNTNHNNEHLVDNKKPIILGLKKVLRPVTGLTKLFAEVSDKSTNNNQPTSSTSINLLHISQTEYPQIFHITNNNNRKEEEEKRNGDNDKGNNDDDGDNRGRIFYPFDEGDLSVESIEEFLRKSKEADAADTELNESDTTINEQEVKKNALGKCTAVKKKGANAAGKGLKVEDFYNDKYILPILDRQSLKMVRNSKSKNVNEASYFIATAKPDTQEGLLLDILNGYKINGLNNDNNNPRNFIKKTQPLSKTDVKDYKKQLEEITLSNIITTDENASMASETVRGLTTTKLTTAKRLTPTTYPTFNDDKSNPYLITGTLDSSNSLNLQISLNLKINNNSYSLIPGL